MKYVSHIKIAWPSDAWLPGFLSWNPVTQELTVVDVEGKLLKTDLEQSTAKPLFAKQEKAVKAAQWSPDGTRLATIDREDGSVAVCDAQTGKLIASIPVDGASDLLRVLDEHFSSGGVGVGDIWVRNDDPLGLFVKPPGAPTPGPKSDKTKQKSPITRQNWPLRRRYLGFLR